MKKQTATFMKWVGTAVVALGLLYAVLAGGSLLAAQANADLNRAYEALAADGRPMKAEQIIPARIPDSDNAALLYQVAVLQLKAETGVKSGLFAELIELADRILAEKPDNQAEEQFKALSERQVVQDAMAILRRGTMKAGCRFDVDYSKGAEIPLPHAGDLRNMTKILCAQGRLSAQNGNVGQAWDDAIASLRLANSLQTEPLLISQLARSAQFDLTADLIRSVAEIGLPSQLQYDEIMKLLLSFENTAPFVLAMDGDRLLVGEWAFRLPLSALNKIIAEQEDGSTKRKLTTALLSRDHAAYLTAMRACSKNASEPYSSDDAELMERLLKDVPPDCVITRMIIPAYSPVKGRYVSMIAQERVIRAGLAALQYASKEGGYAERLDALKAGNLVDPFTGKALIYRTTPSGFVVYSVGQNLVDEGGAASKQKGVGDIVWICSAAKRAEPEN